jgi:2-oxoglutarate dehydrogenase E2 component (dihydrolipoamide succinyltransferase)
MSIELKVPEVGESVTEVYIGDWLKSEGDQVEEGEALVELESEKATFELPAPAAGVLSKILKSSGEEAGVGEVIGHLEKGDGQKPKKQGEERSEESEKKQKETKEPPQREERTKKKQEGDGEEEADERPIPTVETEPRVMPAAARLLKEHGLKADEVKATGPGGRLLKEDVLKYVESGKRAERTKAAPKKPKRTPTTDREEEHVPLSPIRRRIASRLVEAQQNAALLTTFNEIDMTAVKQLRAEYRDAFQKEYGVKLGFMSFFIKAAVDALERVPQLNAEIRDDSIIYRNYYDIGIAIGSEKGLIVPVLRDAHQKSFAEIELAIDDFSQRASQNQLKVEELSGGTFTISNGGIYGSLLSTPIVNPPQSGVLGMHAIQDRPVAHQGEIVIRPMMYIALTYDHRIVDGREAVTFLKRIKDVIEQPARLLIEI